MLPSLRRVLRPAFSLTAGRGLARAGLRIQQTPAATGSSSGLSVLEQRCYLGTHPLKEPVEPLNSPQGAKEFIYSLHPSERTCLLRELHRFESIAIAQGQLEIAPPTAAQLRYVLLHNAIPFVGFGFLDNCIMIVAGTQIELSIGVVLGISTMADSCVKLPTHIDGELCVFCYTRSLPIKACEEQSGAMVCLLLNVEHQSDGAVSPDHIC